MLLGCSLLARYGHTAHRRSTHTPPDEPPRPLSADGSAEPAATTYTFRHPDNCTPSGRDAPPPMSCHNRNHARPREKTRPDHRRHPRHRHHARSPRPCRTAHRDRDRRRRLRRLPPRARRTRPHLGTDTPMGHRPRRRPPRLRRRQRHHPCLTFLTWCGRRSTALAKRSQRRHEGDARCPRPAPKTTATTKSATAQQHRPPRPVHHTAPEGFATIATETAGNGPTPWLACADTPPPPN